MDRKAILITGQGTKEFEEKLNRWLGENKTVKIGSIDHSVMQTDIPHGSQIAKFLTISALIVYEDREMEEVSITRTN